VQIPREGMHDPLEDSVIDPTLKPSMTRLIRGIAIGQVLPGRARPQDPQNSVQDIAGIAPRAAPLVAADAGLRQQRGELRPLRISQVHAVEYDGHRNFVSRPCYQGL